MKTRLLYRTLIGTVVVAATTVFLGAAPAAAAPATPYFGPSIDAYATRDFQDTCDPSPKPGVVSFRDRLNQAYGVHTSGISRSCDVDPNASSEHKEGRALDYHFNYFDTAQRADANDLLTWLLKADSYGNGHAMARRLGIMYIIWNRQIWAAYSASAGWQTYTGSNPHTDHIHFSFSWRGALKQTSWWTGAGDGIAVWRASTGTFHVDDDHSGATDAWIVHGGSGDVPVMGDWVGNGLKGVGIWRASTGYFHLDSDRRDGTDLFIKFGGPNDLPVIGDWDGDGRDGVGAWRASDGYFRLDNDRNGETDVWIKFGEPGDIPVVGDWDGDGRDGVGIWRASDGNFHLDNDRNGYTDLTIEFGGPTDVPVVGDWDGDGRDGVGAWRASDEYFRLDNDRNGKTDLWIKFGGPSDIPIP